MMTYIYIHITEAYQITNPCIVEHAIICTNIDITPGGKKPLSARMMTCVYYRDTWLNTPFLTMLTICYDCERSWQGTQLVTSECLQHGPLVRYVKLRERFPPPRVSDPDMHHGTYVTHVPWCMPGSLISGFPWRRWREKRSRHSRRMPNPQFYISGKRHMVIFYQSSWRARWVIVVKH